MKLTNALNLLTDNEMLFEIEKVTKDYNKYTVIFNQFTLVFYDNKSNDAENFYISKNGVDNGYNGYNGEFFKTLTSAINFLKSK
jgi:hypothetical protein